MTIPLIRRLHLSTPLLGLILLGPAAALGAATETPLPIIFDRSSQPTQYAVEAEVAGVYPRIVATAFKRLNVHVRLQAQPFKRMLEQAYQGRSAAGAVIKTPERLARLDFSDRYFVERVLVYQKRQGSAPFSGLHALNGLHVGVIRGWSYGAAFDAARAAGRFKTEEVDNDMQNFNKLRQGHLDAVLATELSGFLLLKEPKFKELQASTTPLVAADIHLAIPKSAQQQALLQRFNRAISAMRADGDIERIVNAELQRQQRRSPLPPPSAKP